jgi:hypothetical protein
MVQALTGLTACFLGSLLLVAAAAALKQQVALLAVPVVVVVDALLEDLPQRQLA